MQMLLTLADSLNLSSWLLAQAGPEPSLLERILERPQVVVFGFLTIVIIIPTLARMWVSMKTKEWEASLKHTMLERGMSAQEIQMVLNAGSGRGSVRKDNCANSVIEQRSGGSETTAYGPTPQV